MTTYDGTQLQIKGKFSFNKFIISVMGKILKEEQAQFKNISKNKVLQIKKALDNNSCNVELEQVRGKQTILYNFKLKRIGKSGH